MALNFGMRQFFPSLCLFVPNYGKVKRCDELIHAVEAKLSLPNHPNTFLSL